MGEQGFRRAPRGFSEEQWATFQDTGLLVVEDALSGDEVAGYLAAFGRVMDADAAAPDRFFTATNFVERDPGFASLIDRASHIGHMYDLFGEMLKLQLSEMFHRPPGAERAERWHIDGARLTPYAAFAPEIPLQIRVGYWLTDTLFPDMGNLVYVPGSHRRPYFDAYSTHEDVAGQVSLCVAAGTMTIMNTAVWHRTAANKSGETRKNLYLGYSPSWIPTVDRTMSDPQWLATLNREQRILMRSYDRAYHHAKPPESDVPLFLDRDTGLDRDRGKYRDHVHMLHRKRALWWEKLT